MSRTFSSMYRNNYSSDYISNLSMKCSKTCAINNYPIDNDSIYLKITDAALTYLTITDAALTYLTIVDASTNYLSRVGVATSIATSTFFNGGDIYVQGSTFGLGGGSVANNVACGGNALLSNTTGNQNVAIGYQALQNNTTNSANVAIGYNAAQTDGILNSVAIGYVAGSLTTTAGNCFVGFAAMNRNTTGEKNTALGYQTGYFNTTASNSCFVGSTAGWKNTSGNSNTYIGSGAGYTNTTGQNNTNIGAQTGTSGVVTYNNSSSLGASTVIGASTSTAIGYGATTSVANSIVLGTATETVYCPGTDASGSLVLYGGLTLQTAYLAVPTSTMLGYSFSVFGSLVSLSNNANANLSGIGISIPTGIWSVNWIASIIGNANGSSFNSLVLVVSNNSGSVSSGVLPYGQYYSYATETMNNGDKSVRCASFTYTNITAIPIVLYVNTIMLFSGSFSGVADIYATRIG